MTEKYVPLVSGLLNELSVSSDKRSCFIEWFSNLGVNTNLSLVERQFSFVEGLEDKVSLVGNDLVSDLPKIVKQRELFDYSVCNMYLISNISSLPDCIRDVYISVISVINKRLDSKV